MAQPMEVLISDSEESSRSESSLYAVEWIKKKRIDDHGVVYYLIKWKGYPESMNTWEPLENLECNVLLEDFEQRCQIDPSLVIDQRKKPKLKNEHDVSMTTVANRGKESILQKSKQLSGKRKRSSNKKQSVAKDERNGFEKGYSAEMIIGATNSSGKLKFLVKWKNLNEAELIDAELANEKCPQVVIKYLSDRISWI